MQNRIKSRWAQCGMFFLSLGLFSVNLFAGDVGSVKKQIAALPDAIVDGRHQLPQPQDKGIRSKLVSFAVDFQKTAHGAWGWKGFVDFAQLGATQMAVFGKKPGNWRVTVLSPAGQQIRLDQQQGAGPQTDRLVLPGGNGLPARKMKLDVDQIGRWQIRITTDAGINTKPDAGLLVVENNSPYRLYTHLQHYRLHQGEQIGFVAYLYDHRSEGVQGSINPIPVSGVLHSANLIVRMPSGLERAVDMLDDGLHGDRLAGDGIFGARFTALQAGDYRVQIRTHGLMNSVQRFSHSSRHVFPVIEQGVRLINPSAVLFDTGSGRVEVVIRGFKASQVQRSIKAFAELWASNPAGEWIPVVWFGGMVDVEDVTDGQRLRLGLDQKWLARQAIQAPFQLRNLRIQDIGTHIPLAEQKVLTLAQGNVARSVLDSSEDIPISRDMLMGVAPKITKSQNSGIHVAQGALMMVHGYCSEGVWPLAQFTDAVEFQDFNQNRTHDEFANLLLNFGAQFPTFGIVAHSQGGAASLHLYTYYFSGLDLAQGPRRIQSVGSPYQGTYLAGDIADWAQQFGIGCGSNWDMSYDGAALWLAGIPDWARAEVYYHSTSFRDRWWAYDYCSLPTDLFLSDPDDGVVEQSAAQLPMANDMGHKTGWCHSTGMRDPAQYRDSSRNADMDINAAR